MSNNPNPFLSSTHASVYLRASQNSHSTFRSALYKTIKSDSHRFLTLDGPIVYGRSEDPFSDGSFTITTTHDFALDCDMHQPDSEDEDEDDSLSDPPTLSPESTPDTHQAFHALTCKVTKLKNQLYGPSIGSESPSDLQNFLIRLDSILPNRGIIALKDTPCLSHQSILFALAARGHLLFHVLEEFRSTNIHSLSLTETLRNDAKIDLPATNTLIVLSYPNSFTTLSSLDLSHVPLLDSDVRYLVSLPALQVLFLESTGISNIGVFQLVALPHLVKLVIAYNSLIDNDSVAALASFTEIMYLDLVGTGIDMVGARRLATASLSMESIVILPVVCGRYLSGLDALYLTHPRAPLITDPSRVRALTYAQLKSNLSAHAAHNLSISAAGTKEDLVARLEGILTTRALDLAVLHRFGNHAPKEDVQVSRSSSTECWPEEDEQLV